MTPMSLFFIMNQNHESVGADTELKASVLNLFPI